MRILSIEFRDGLMGGPAESPADKVSGLNLPKITGGSSSEE